MYKTYQVNQKSLGIYTVNEWNAEWKKVMIYKAAYKKRMQLKAKEVLTERSKMIKERTNFMDKTYQFSIPMSWSIYKEDRRNYNRKAHLNENINSNNLDTVMKRYADWIQLRTDGFYKALDQRFGPEFALIGNDKIIWTTANKNKVFERQMMLGVTNWASRFKLQHPSNNGIFLTGTLDGKFKATKCNTFNQCKQLYSEHDKKGYNSVPYILFKGQKRLLAKFASSSDWNGLQSKYEQIWNLIGQYLLTDMPSSVSDGIVLNMGTSGMKVSTAQKKSH